jgi:hypothetical protein
VAQPLFQYSSEDFAIAKGVQSPKRCRDQILPGNKGINNVELQIIILWDSVSHVKFEEIYFVRMENCLVLKI